MNPLQKSRESYVVELNGDGHRLWYVSLLLKETIRSSRSGTLGLVTSCQAVDSVAWRQYIAPILAEANDIDLKIVSDSVKRTTILRWASRSRAELVIPDGDQWLWPLLWARLLNRTPTRVNVLIMRPVADSTVGSQWRHVIKRLLMTAVEIAQASVTLLHLAPVASDSKQRNVVLDPIKFEPRALGRNDWLRQHSLETERAWLLVAGELSGRKCVEELADVFASGHVSEWGLLLAGRAPEDLLERLRDYEKRSNRRVAIIHGFLSDLDFDTFVDHADAVAVLHRNEGSSGVLLKCWAAGTAALVGGASTIVKAAAQLNMKRVEVDEISAAHLRAGILSLPRRSGIEAPPPAAWNDRAREFAERLLGQTSASEKLSTTDMRDLA